jgi:hypothetical protein
MINEVAADVSRGLVDHWRRGDSLCDNRHIDATRSTINERVPQLLRRQKIRRGDVAIALRMRESNIDRFLDLRMRIRNERGTNRMNTCLLLFFTSDSRI